MIREKILESPFATRFYTGLYDEPDTAYFFVKKDKEREAKFEVIPGSFAKFGDYFIIGGFFRLIATIEKIYEYSVKAYRGASVSSPEWRNAFKNLGRSFVALTPGVGFITLLFYDWIQYTSDAKRLNAVLAEREDLCGLAINGEVVVEHSLSQDISWKSLRVTSFATAQERSDEAFAYQYVIIDFIQKNKPQNFIEEFKAFYADSRQEFCDLVTKTARLRTRVEELRSENEFLQILNEVAQLLERAELPRGIRDNILHSQDHAPAA